MKSEILFREKGREYECIKYGESMFGGCRVCGVVCFNACYKIQTRRQGMQSWLQVKLFIFGYM